MDTRKNSLPHGIERFMQEHYRTGAAHATAAIFFSRETHLAALSLSQAHYPHELRFEYTTLLPTNVSNKPAHVHNSEILCPKLAFAIAMCADHILLPMKKRDPSRFLLPLTASYGERCFKSSKSSQTEKKRNSSYLYASHMRTSNRFTSNFATNPHLQQHDTHTTHTLSQLSFLACTLFFTL